MSRCESQLLALLMATLVLAGCAQVPGTPEIATAVTVDSEPWQSTFYHDHPLVGRIWHHAGEQFISDTTLAQQLANNNIVLLGEKHDNPDHHRLRLALLQQLLEQRHIRVLAMEMLTSQQQSAVDTLGTSVVSDPEKLREQLEWDDGWTWSYYHPVLELALNTQGLQLRSANIDREQIMSIYQGDMTPDVTSALIGALDAEQLHRLNEDIDISHCGLLPDSQFESMVRVQQVRDLAMAQSLGGSPPGTPVGGLRVLLAGNYHVRHDVGVPNYLSGELPGEESMVSVAFLEVAPGQHNPQDYQRVLQGTAAWDYIWFTPALTDEDYCERMAGGT